MAGDDDSDMQQKRATVLREQIRRLADPQRDAEHGTDGRVVGDSTPASKPSPRSLIEERMRQLDGKSPI